MTPPRDWTVLLIGGGSATGKSTLAAALGRRLDTKVLEGDLIRTLLMSNVSAEDDSDLHAFSQPNLWDSSLENRVEASFRAASRVCQRSTSVVPWYLKLRRPVILEAVWLLPEYVQEMALLDTTGSPQVRCLFLYEADIDNLRERLRQRLDWIERVSPEGLEPRLEMFHGYGLEIKRQAEALGLPVLESRPFETLEERALHALDIRP